MFAYSDSGGDNAWTGTVLGLIEMERGRYAGSRPGTCVGIIGTLTPTQVEGPTSDGRTVPDLTVIAGGVEGNLDGWFECDHEIFADAGFGSPHDAEVTVGTVYPFVQPIFLVGDPSQTPELIAVGDPSSDEAMYFEPTMLPDLPAVPAS